VTSKCIFIHHHEAHYSHHSLFNLLLYICNFVYITINFIINKDCLLHLVSKLNSRHWVYYTHNVAKTSVHLPYNSQDFHTTATLRNRHLCSVQPMPPHIASMAYSPYIVQATLPIVVRLYDSDKLNPCTIDSITKQLIKSPSKILYDLLSSVYTPHSVVKIYFY
jgi:hypothetical protein